VDELLALATNGVRTGFASLERPFQPVEERVSGRTPYLYWPGPGRRGAEFTEEFYAINADPAATLADIAAAHPGPDHLVSTIDSTQFAQSDAWTTAGYEVGSTEPIMLLALADIPSSAPNLPVTRVSTLSEAEAIAEAHRAIGYPVRQCNQAFLNDPALRYLQICLEGRPVCVGKLALGMPCAYITDVVTQPDYRNRGLASALMHAMHGEAREFGATYVALTATAMARPLYAALGYAVIAEQVLWCTPERD
jgi:GNAT superfamily N-acetyltransferase